MRELYVGPNPEDNDDEKDIKKNNECILVMNNWDRVPTAGSMELYAWRLYLAQRSCDVNVSSQRFPVMVVGDEKQRLMLENLYSQYDGNKPFIFGNKNQLNNEMLKTINTEAPYVADKLVAYKKEIWNEFLEYIGVNAISIEKKERLITTEVDSNNQFIKSNEAR